MGLRVEAVWVDPSEWGPSMASVKYFKPNGEPEADYESYREYLCNGPRSGALLRSSRSLRPTTSGVRTVTTKSRCSYRLSPNLDNRLHEERYGVRVLRQLGLSRRRPIQLRGALDAVGAWPPMRESHVEMDGALRALYEAWTMLQAGDCDTALVYSFGRSSQCQLDRVLASSSTPITWRRSGPIRLRSPHSRRRVAGLRKGDGQDFAEVAARESAGSRRKRKGAGARERVGERDDGGGIHRVPAAQAHECRRYRTVRQQWCSPPAIERGSCVRGLRG